MKNLNNAFKQLNECLIVKLVTDSERAHNRLPSLSRTDRAATSIDRGHSRLFPLTQTARTTRSPLPSSKGNPFAKALVKIRNFSKIEPVGYAMRQRLSGSSFRLPLTLPWKYVKGNVSPEFPMAEMHWEERSDSDTIDRRRRSKSGREGRSGAKSRALGKKHSEPPSFG